MSGDFERRFACLHRTYVEQFGEPMGGHVEIQRDEHSPIVAIETYRGFSPEARIFATLGLCQFESEIGQAAELVLTADDAFDDAIAGLIQAVSFLAGERIPITIGDTFYMPEHLGRIASEFGKVALYVTFGGYLLGKADLVHCAEDDHLRIYLLVAISAAERGFLLAGNGARAFEERMAAAEASFAHLARPSAI